MVRAGVDHPLEKREVLRSNHVHSGWLALADGDKHRLKNFRDMVFAEGNRRFSYSQMMGFYVSNEEGPSLRPVVLSRLEDGSVAGGWGHVDVGSALLVGIAADAADLPLPSSASGAGHAEVPLEARVEGR